MDNSNDEHSVTQLIRRLRSNSSGERQDAAHFLWNRYHTGLLGFVLVRMDDFLRKNSSPDSVIDIAFFEALERIRVGGASPFSRRELLSLLRATARRRLVDKARELKAPSRNPGADRFASASGEPTPEFATEDRDDISFRGAAYDIESGKPVREPKRVTRSLRKPMPTEHLKQEPDDLNLPPLEALMMDASPEVQAVVYELFELLDDELKRTFVLWIQLYSDKEIAELLGIEQVNVMLNIACIKQKWTEGAR